jgi:phosphatidylinositol alpha-mannosyltransferase
VRVGLVCPYDLSRPGGVQAQVLGLAESLTGHGDDVRVIGPGLPDGVEGVDLGPTISVRGNRSVVPLSLDPRVLGVIKRAAADLDILHVHEPLMPVVSLSALRAGRPVVATFHAAPGTVGLGFYTVLRPQLRRVLGPHVRQVTAVSQTAAGPLPGDLDPTIIPNGLDVAAFESGRERVPNRVAFLGRDEKRKGLDVLLRAWEKVAEAIPDAELVVMGADRSLEGISWLGLVDDATKIDTLGSTSVYVAPNLGGESFGIVLVEAMAAGAVVLASDLRAFQEVGGQAARYFATGNSDDLARQLIDLLTDATTVRRLSDAGRALAWRFDWRGVSSRYRAVYEQALS